MYRVTSQGADPDVIKGEEEAASTLGFRIVTTLPTILFDALLHFELRTAH